MNAISLKNGQKIEIDRSKDMIVIGHEGPQGGFHEPIRLSLADTATLIGDLAEALAES